MTTTKYYIEDLATGKCLQNAGEPETWKQFEPAFTYLDNEGQTINVANTAKSFTDYNSALGHIDTLTSGEYRIFTRIVKS